MKRIALLTLCLASALACAPKVKIKVTTAYVLRHAEKLTTGSDPDLSVEGHTRAAALVVTLQDVKIDAIYATEFLRTQNTVAPLADARALTVGAYQAANSSAIAELILEKHSGQGVVVCGHSNTVGEIIQALGHDELIQLTESDYGDLFIITITDGNATLVRTRFGL